MCTNFTPTHNRAWIESQFGVHLPDGFPQEAYPGYLAPIIVKSHQSGRVACGLAQFGLVPHWAKDASIARHTYNARSETVAEKPSFRSAWRNRQFALLPVDRFFEPKYVDGHADEHKAKDTGAMSGADSHPREGAGNNANTAASQRAPVSKKTHAIKNTRPVRWSIELESGEPFCIACVWDQWVHPVTQARIVSFSMLTCNADEHPVMQQFHKPEDEKRTPVIIAPENHAAWLDADTEQARSWMHFEHMPLLRSHAAPKT